VVSRVFRHRQTEVGIEFTDGTRLFVDKASDGVDLSIADGKPGSVERSQPQAGAQSTYTRLQGRYLMFIQEYLRLHGVAPSEGDLQSHFQVTAPTVHQMIVTLERKGLIERVPGKARSIKLLVEPGGFFGHASGA
jgi:hypothetical protein